MDLDCLPQNMAISSLRNNHMSGNICVFHDPSKILKLFELKVHFEKCIYENYNSTVGIFKK